jgi:hypothetical protein
MVHRFHCPPPPPPKKNIFFLRSTFFFSFYDGAITSIGHKLNEASIQTPFVTGPILFCVAGLVGPVLFCFVCVYVLYVKHIHELQAPSS